MKMEEINSARWYPGSKVSGAVAFTARRFVERELLSAALTAVREPPVQCRPASAAHGAGVSL